MITLSSPMQLVSQHLSFQTPSGRVHMMKMDVGRIKVDKKAIKQNVYSEQASWKELTTGIT